MAAHHSAAPIAIAVQSHSRRDPLWADLADGPEAVGKLASQFTAKVSAYDPNDPKYDSSFCAEISQVVRQLASSEPLSHHAVNTALDAPPSVAEISLALDDAKSKLHKAAGLDGITNWMLVWSGDTMLTLAKYVLSFWSVRCQRA